MERSPEYLFLFNYLITYFVNVFYILLKYKNIDSKAYRSLSNTTTIIGTG